MKISYNWLKEYINFDQSLEEIGERPTRNQAYSYTYFLANAQRKESAEQLRNLVKKGVLGGPVMEYEDIYATYEELKSKGVKLTKQPTKEFYKTEAVFKDDSGNWFSLGERKK